MNKFDQAKRLKRWYHTVSLCIFLYLRLTSQRIFFNDERKKKIILQMKEELYWNHLLYFIRWLCCVHIVAELKYWHSFTFIVRRKKKTNSFRSIRNNHELSRWRRLMNEVFHSEFYANQMGHISIKFFICSVRFGFLNSRNQFIYDTV